MAGEAAGHVKHNVETGAVAVRTVFDSTQFPNMVWLIATTGNGAQNGREDDVLGWADLFTPTPPPEPEMPPAPPEPEPQP